SGDRVVSGHAEALALPYGWVRLPRPQPGRGAGHHLPQGRRLRRLREDPAPGQGLVLGALFGLLPYAQSLAPCPVAAQRWRSLEIPALADGHAHATLPCPLPHGRQRPAVPGALQVFPDRRGRTFAERAALRRAESAAGRPGAPCGGLALVQPVAAAAGRKRGRESFFLTVLPRAVNVSPCRGAGAAILVGTLTTLSTAAWVARRSSARTAITPPLKRRCARPRSGVRSDCWATASCPITGTWYCGPSAMVTCRNSCAG